MFQGIYRDFAGPEGAGSGSSVRLVPLRTRDLSTITRRLKPRGLRSFDSGLFANGLDVRQCRLHTDARPDAANKQWMVDAPSWKPLATAYVRRAMCSLGKADRS